MIEKRVIIADIQMIAVKRDVNEYQPRDGSRAGLFGWKV